MSQKEKDGRDISKSSCSSYIRAMGSRIASYHLTSLKSLQNHCAGPSSLYSQVEIFIPIAWAFWSFSVSRAKNSNLVAPCNRWFMISRGFVSNCAQIYHGIAFLALLTLELLKLANGRRMFFSENPFGNFGLPPKKSRFPEKIFVRETKLIFPFTFYPKFPDTGHLYQ